MPPDWLPELVAHRTFLIDRFPCHLPSLDERCQQQSDLRELVGVAAVSEEWRQMLVTGMVKNRSELARRVGVSRARITQALRAVV